jgi:hypothetical protein
LTFRSIEHGFQHNNNPTPPQLSTDATKLKQMFRGAASPSDRQGGREEEKEEEIH